MLCGGAKRERKESEMAAKHGVKRFLYEIVVIALGCAMFAVGFDACVAPNHFSIGGMTGVAQIINALIPALPVGALTIALNVPLFILGWIYLGKRALAKSLFAMVLSSLMLDGLAMVYTFPTMDPMLASVYGGVLLGASMGSLMLVNTTTGGTELGARLLKFPLPHLSIGKLCLCIDVIVVSVYAAVFHSILNAMYGIIALYISSIVMDYIIYGSRTAQVAYIVSDRYEQITEKLLSMDRGLTLLNGEGAYSKQQRKVLLCAMKRSQIVPVKLAVKEIDPDAFVIVCKANEVLGEGFGEYTKDDI